MYEFILYTYVVPMSRAFVFRRLLQYGQAYSGTYPLILCCTQCMLFIMIHTMHSYLFNNNILYCIRDRVNIERVYNKMALSHYDRTWICPLVQYVAGPSRLRTQIPLSCCQRSHTHAHMHIQAYL